MTYFLQYQCYGLAQHGSSGGMAGAAGRGARVMYIIGVLHSNTQVSALAHLVLHKLWLCADKMKQGGNVQCGGSLPAVRGNCRRPPLTSCSTAGWRARTGAPHCNQCPLPGSRWPWGWTALRAAAADPASPVQMQAM